MVSLSSNYEREIEDNLLTRTACYLVSAGENVKKVERRLKSEEKKINIKKEDKQ